MSDVAETVVNLTENAAEEIEARLWAPRRTGKWRRRQTFTGPPRLSTHPSGFLRARLTLADRCCRTS